MKKPTNSSDRAVLVGVSGGIAAYKMCDVIRRLADRGIKCRVVMTPNATRFITPLTLAALAGTQVLVDEFPPEAGAVCSSFDPLAHISLSEECEVLLIAPATANTIAKLANGIADNLLTSAALAWEGPVLIAPAMNTRMYAHSATQENLRRLKERGIYEIEPDEGWLACGETGRGRLATPERIVTEVVRALADEDGPLTGKRIVVTAGGTREYLDPIRFVSNASTGTLALMCAYQLALHGAMIELIAGPGTRQDLLVELPAQVIAVTTSEDMRRAVVDRTAGCDALLMLAAVADFAPEPVGHKIKKEEFAELTLKLKRTTDILAELADNRTFVKVGASLETEQAQERAQAKLAAKKLDAIVAVDYSAERPPFGDGTIKAGVFTGSGVELETAEREKLELAERITHLIIKLITEKEKP
jgi:phosphopantothenoylcysteine decarboxylase/phosphopantothenate--cysteine ligase